MIVKLLTEHHLEFLSLKGGCTGLSGPTLDKMPHCWKSRVTAQILLFSFYTKKFGWSYVYIKGPKCYNFQKYCIYGP